MSRKILILGASYGSLLGTKLLMAGHDVTLVCRQQTADLINAEGTDVRLRLRGEDRHRSILSGAQPGNLTALAPAQVDPSGYDLVALAMAEPQYGSGEIRALMSRIAKARVPCLSIMNMPPLPYLRRVPGLNADTLTASYAAPEIWDDFDPELVTLCSPDPQAFRSPEEKANVLFVGLPTNFKAAGFADPVHDRLLRDLETDIAAVRLDGADVPVKLRVFDSLFVPFAKWSMLLTGNYRCVTPTRARPIAEAVHDDLALSEKIYVHVDAIVQKLGADPADGVPFVKYAEAAKGLLRPSSVARAVQDGSCQIERVDLLVKLVADQVGMGSADIDAVARTVDGRVRENRAAAN